MKHQGRFADLKEEHIAKMQAFVDQKIVHVQAHIQATAKLVEVVSPGGDVRLPAYEKSWCRGTETLHHDSGKEVILTLMI